MVPSGEQEQALRRAYVLFYSYRWLAWVFAALSLTLPGQNASDLPEHAGLLVITVGLNIASTAFGTDYVRIATRRSWLLGVDLFICAALVLISGGEIRPYFFYALTSLILPGLLFRWRGALWSTGFFIILDLIVMAYTGAIAGQPFALVLPRLTLPIAFSAFFALLPLWLEVQFKRHEAMAESFPPLPSLPTERPTPPIQPSRFSSRNESLTPTDRTLPTTAAEVPATAHLMAIHTTIPNSTHELRRTIVGFTPSFEPHLPTVLTSLTDQFGQFSGVTTQMIILGHARTLPIAHHNLLLRVAQESLINIHQHARAQHALMTLQYASQHVILTIQDDGVGLLDGTYETPGLHTLRAIHYRLAEFDGEFEVCEGESGGVTVRALLPLE